MVLKCSLTKKAGPRRKKDVESKSNEARYLVLTKNTKSILIRQIHETVIFHRLWSAGGWVRHRAGANQYFPARGECVALGLRFSCAGGRLQLERGNLAGACGRDGTKNPVQPRGGDGCQAAGWSAVGNQFASFRARFLV